MNGFNEKIKFVLLTLWPALLISSCQPNASEAESAKKFLEQIYRQYDHDGPDTANSGASEMFDTELLALIHEDQRIAGEEVGLLNHDPICACQDWENLVVKIIEVILTHKNQAKADVTFTNSNEVVRVGFTLVRQLEQWRISDIEEPVVTEFESVFAGWVSERRECRSAITTKDSADFRC